MHGIDPLRARVLEMRAKSAPKIASILAKREADRTEADKAKAAAIKAVPTYEERVREFFDLIDTSAGPDECHPWKGARKFNHPAGHIARFEQAIFKSTLFNTAQATRILCLLTYGREVPAGKDVTPLCEDHLCCNVRHFVITPEGCPSLGLKLNKGQPAEEFFCEAKA